jgi:hypothetical protein
LHLSSCRWELLRGDRVAGLPEETRLDLIYKRRNCRVEPIRIFIQAQRMELLAPLNERLGGTWFLGREGIEQDALAAGLEPAARKPFPGAFFMMSP